LSRSANAFEPPDPCVDESAAVAYVQQLLPAEDRARVEEHASQCEPCRLLISELLREGEDADASARSDGGTRVGRYVVLDCVGIGGMGVVFRAYDPALDRKIALKLMRSESDSPDGQGRVQREAMALARVSHPNVVTIHDVGEVGAQTYIAMELIEGGSLRDWAAERPRTAREILAVFRQAGEGLAAAHAAGLVHRDFKPDNVMVHSDGRVCVTDFGLARMRVAASPGEEAGSQTERSREAGTPAYMSPEQRAGGIADQHSDQFSFCLSMQEALLGYRTSRDEPARGRLRGKDGRRAPRWLRNLILRGLSTRPEDRFPSMRALLDTVARAQRWRRWSPLVAGAVLIVIAASVLEFHLFKGPRDPQYKYDAGRAPVVGWVIDPDHEDGWYCGMDPLLNDPALTQWHDARQRESDKLYMIFKSHIHVVGHCTYGCDNTIPGIPSHCKFAPGINPLTYFPQDRWTRVCGGPASPLGIEAVGVATSDGGTYAVLNRRRGPTAQGYYTTLIDVGRSWEICR
jgi:hypothetical protein